MRLKYLYYCLYISSILVKRSDYTLLSGKSCDCKRTDFSIEKLGNRFCGLNPLLCLFCGLFYFNKIDTEISLLRALILQQKLVCEYDREKGAYKLLFFIQVRSKV